MENRVDANAQQPGDQPTILHLNRFSCLLGSMFICPYHVRVTDDGAKSICLCARHGDQQLKVGKESINGGGLYPHPVYVGFRLPECRETPPSFYIVDPCTSQSPDAIRDRAREGFMMRVQGATRRSTSNVDKQKPARGGPGDELSGVRADQTGSDGVQDGERDRPAVEEDGGS